MKVYKQILQSPLVKIFLSPIASVLLGLSLGVHRAEKVHWINILMLILLAIAGQLVQHALHLKIERENEEGSPLILYICEAVLFLSAITLTLQNSWIMGLLLALYIVYVHASYIPYNFSQTFYGLILGVFYEAFILNVIAYYSQMKMVDTATFIQIAPFSLAYMASLFEIIVLKSRLSHKESPLRKYHNKWLAPALYAASLIWGYYQALPSQSYFIVQILFIVVVAFAVVPTIITTSNDHQVQNKINYLSAINLIFAAFYSLALIY